MTSAKSKSQSRKEVLQALIYWRRAMAGKKGEDNEQSVIVADHRLNPTCAAYKIFISSFGKVKHTYKNLKTCSEDTMMRWIILSGSFIYRIFLVFGPLGSSSFECAPEIQKAEVNDKIKIKCALIPEFTEVKKHVVWNLNRSTILHYNQTGSILEYTSQKRMVPVALNKTEIALTISDVQMSDFGFYHCFVVIDEITKDCPIYLQPMFPSTANSTTATNSINAAQSPLSYILPFALVIAVCGIGFIIALIYQRKKRRASGNMLGEDQTQSHPENTSMLV